MPRGFTPIETNRIKIALLDAGQEMLPHSGVRKTTVQSLARAARISTGEFYAFFPSKEALFFQVYERLESQLKSRFIRLVTDTPVTGLEDLKRAVIALLLSDDMQNLVNLVKSEELDYLLRGLAPEQLDQHLQSDRQYLAEAIKLLQSTCTVEADVDLILAYLQAVFILCYEKGMIGAQFERVLESFVHGMLLDCCRF